MDDQPALRITNPGPATTVQDLGRLGARRWGVPQAGTLLPDWLTLANGLVGNPAGAAGLEFRLAGPAFTVEAEELLVALAGSAELRIESEGESRTVPAWCAAKVRRGEKVSVGRLAGGLGLLAFSGGLSVPEILGSRSTYVRAHLGGLEGRALKAGDSLPLGDQAGAAPLALEQPPEEERGPIRLIPGPQEDHFAQGALARLLEGPYRVTDQVDRMGMRLEGPELEHRTPELAQIASDGIVPGAIQVPGSGQPIVLLADGQTVGGYPKIGTVIAADLPRLARAAPGTELHFAETSVAEAQSLLRQHRERLARLLDGARPASLVSGIDLRRLYESNLISGVVDVTGPDHFPGSLGTP